MKKLLMLFLGLGVLGIDACKDTLGIDGNASAADRQEILAAVDETGLASEDFGNSSPEANFQFGALGGDFSAVSAAVAAGNVTLPALWAVRLGAPTSKTRTVNTVNDTATVNVLAEFNAQFMMIVPQNGATPQTVTKPAVVTLTQNLVLVKNDAVDPNDPTAMLRHKWRIIQLSPQNWQLKDETKRTTKITRVRVLVNGTTKIEVTDPSLLFDVNNKMPRLQRGDVVQVLADVSNTANTGNTPPTFVFLHVMHADPAGLGWRRIIMQDVGGGSFQLSWVVRQAGRDRLVVQALDSQTFQTDASTEARGNAWAIPYRIE